MIIDCHGHVSAPAQLWAYKAGLLASRGSHGRGGVKVSDDEMRAALNARRNRPEGPSRRAASTTAPTCSSSRRGRSSSCTARSRRKLVHWFAEECHNIIHRQTQMYPNKFFGVASLPQVAGRADRARAARARALREAARLRRLPAQSRPVREFGRRAASAGRPLLVSALRKAVRARRSRAYPHRKLPLRARQLFGAPHQRGHDRDPGPAQFRCVQGLSEAEDHRVARRRRDPLSARPLRCAIAARPRRGAVPRPAQASLFRYGALHRAGARAADQDGRCRTAACSVRNAPASAPRSIRIPGTRWITSVRTSRNSSGCRRQTAKRFSPAMRARCSS